MLDVELEEIAEKSDTLWEELVTRTAWEASGPFPEMDWSNDVWCYLS